MFINITDIGRKNIENKNRKGKKKYIFILFFLYCKTDPAITMAITSMEIQKFFPITVGCIYLKLKINVA